MLFIFLIALSLAMDAFAVSVSCGLSVKDFSARHALLMGLYFGVFQALMIVLGWSLGSSVSHYVSSIGPYLSFLLLAVIGGKMIWNALSGDGSRCIICLTHRRLIVLAIATSIDALAVGVSFAFMDVNLLLSAAVIGLVAFLLSVLGGLLGGRLSSVFRKRAEVIGGIVLIGIGLKILIESFVH
jgi:putative Mn2+ efflux pump MntP